MANAIKFGPARRSQSQDEVRITQGTVESASNSYSDRTPLLAPMLAVTLAPWREPIRNTTLTSQWLTVLVGVVCILADLCGAGFVATLLARLFNGFLNGTS